MSLLLVATACSSPGRGTVTSEPADESAADLLARLDRRCTDIVTTDLGEGTLCADSGFRMGTDGFAFANWGRSPAADDNISLQTMIDLFGHSAVCLPGDESSCVMRPRTVQQLDEWNTAIANGRCEGMAALSMRLFLRYDLPSDYSERAATATELDRDDPGLSRSIAHWWATQFLPEVADVARQSRLRSPLEIVDDLIVGLANDSGQTLGMYAGGSGHSVAPFAVTERGGSYVIHAYDNNHPGRRTEIIVSPGNEWSYAWGTGPGGGTVDWTGSTGTLELTPMSARMGPFTCGFCTEPADDADTTVTVTSTDSSRGLHVFVDAGDGGTLEVFGSSVVSTIDGATVAFGKSLSSVPVAAPSVTVSLPAAILEAGIELRSAAAGAVTSASTILVRRAGQPDLKVTGAGPTGLVGATRASDPVIRLLQNGAVVRASADRGVGVSVAGETNLVSATVGAGDSLVIDGLDVDQVDSRTIEVTYKGGDGSRAASTTVVLAPERAKNTVLAVEGGLLIPTFSPSARQKVSPAARMRTTPMTAVPTTVPVTVMPSTTVPTIEVTLPD
ncbi:MAG: hypothetical protein EBT79_00960 [Actinobacteria bacterium]|nr:hypothetical protein [Actinomycetota bacterium]NBR65850.1 hypothetical protein [Actinomycetota bacterium]